MEMSMGSVKVTMEPPMANTPESFYVSFQTAMEMMQITGMDKWVQTASEPGQSGFKGDVWMENSQQARLHYLLQGVGCVDPNRIYSVLSTANQRPKTFESPVTRARPVQALALNDHWYLDCCSSLPQKKALVDSLDRLGYSRDFIETAKRFVGGESLSGNIQA